MTRRTPLLAIVLEPFVLWGLLLLWDTVWKPVSVSLWQRWHSGEQAEVSLAVLTAVTIAAPVAIGLGFLLYYLARPGRARGHDGWGGGESRDVPAVFHGGTCRVLDTQETLRLAALLWGATALAAAAGWRLQYPVRCQRRLGAGKRPGSQHRY